MRNMLPCDLRSLAVSNKIQVGTSSLYGGCPRVRGQGVEGRMAGDGGVGVIIPRAPICYMLSCTLLRCVLT